MEQELNITPVLDTEKPVEEKSTKQRTSVKELKEENAALKEQVTALNKHIDELNNYADTVFATSNDMSNKIQVVTAQLGEMKQYVVMLSTALGLLTKSIEGTFKYLGGKQ